MSIIIFVSLLHTHMYFVPYTNCTIKVLICTLYFVYIASCFVPYILLL
nr:MAG TPA: hypothetical protein [Bacteriophage sp.]